MSKRSDSGFVFTGLMFLGMIIMVVVSVFSRSIQYGGAETVGYDGFLTRNLKANTSDVIIGYVVFAIGIGFVWCFMSNYLKKYEVKESMVAILLEIIIVLGGCFIIFIGTTLGGESIFDDMVGFGVEAEIIWPLCVFGVFTFLFCEAHSTKCDVTNDIGNKDLVYSEESSSSEANDYSFREIDSREADDYSFREIGSSIANDYYLREIGEKDK